MSYSSKPFWTIIRYSIELFSESQKHSHQISRGKKWHFLPYKGILHGWCLCDRWTVVLEEAFVSLAQSSSSLVGSQMAGCVVWRGAVTPPLIPFLGHRLEIETWRKTTIVQVRCSVLLTHAPSLVAIFKLCCSRIYVSRPQAAGLLPLLGSRLCSSGLTGLSVPPWGPLHACL